jgi:hypothetical protein
MEGQTFLTGICSPAGAPSGGVGEKGSMQVTFYLVGRHGRDRKIEMPVLKPARSFVTGLQQTLQQRCAEIATGSYEWKKLVPMVGSNPFCTLDVADFISSHLHVKASVTADVSPSKVINPIVAATPIDQGTRVLVARAAAIVSSPDAALSAEEVNDKLLQHLEAAIAYNSDVKAQVEAIPSSDGTLASVIARYAVYFYPTFGDAAKYPDGKLYGLAFFPQLAQFAHSCSPNCTLQMFGDFVLLTAAQRIEAGEKVSVSFIQTDAWYDSRHLQLQQRKMECTCVRCVDTREDRVDLTLARLWAAVPKILRMQGPTVKEHIAGGLPKILCIVLTELGAWPGTLTTGPPTWCVDDILAAQHTCYVVASYFEASNNAKIAYQLYKLEHDIQFGFSNPPTDDVTANTAAKVPFQLSQSMFSARRCQHNALVGKLGDAVFWWWFRRAEVLNALAHPPGAFHVRPK